MPAHKHTHAHTRTCTSTCSTTVNMHTSNARHLHGTFQGAHPSFLGVAPGEGRSICAAASGLDYTTAVPRSFPRHHRPWVVVREYNSRVASAFLGGGSCICRAPTSLDLTCGNVCACSNTDWGPEGKPAIAQPPSWPSLGHPHNDIGLTLEIFLLCYR